VFHSYIEKLGGYIWVGKNVIVKKVGKNICSIFAIKRLVAQLLTLFFSFFEKDIIVDIGEHALYTFVFIPFSLVRHNSNSFLNLSFTLFKKLILLFLLIVLLLSLNLNKIVLETYIILFGCCYFHTLFLIFPHY
jgi:hypothetical protein